MKPNSSNSINTLIARYNTYLTTGSKDRCGIDTSGVVKPARVARVVRERLGVVLDVALGAGGCGGVSFRFTAARGGGVVGHNDAVEVGYLLA